MSEGEEKGIVESAIDTAAEITDAMMSSMAGVVRTVASGNSEHDNEESAETEIVIVEENDTSEISEAQTLEDEVNELVNAGEAAHRNSDHKGALSSFSRAIALDPSNAMAWFNRGVLLEAEQDSKGAKQSFVICLDLDPEHGPALANLAVLLDRIEDGSGAAEIASKALSHFPGHPSLIAILEKAKASGATIPTTPQLLPHTDSNWQSQEIQRASEPIGDDLLSEGVDSVPEVQTPELTTAPEVIPEVELVPEAVDLDALCAEAKELLAAGDAKGALTLLKPHLHSEAAEHFDSWNISAGAMASMSLDDHAIGAYTHALGLNDNHAKSWFNLGAIHQRKGNNEAATKCFAGALERDATYLKAAERLAEIAEASGDIERLLSARRILAANDPVLRNEFAILLVELAEGEARVLENTAGLPPTIPEGPALAEEAVSLLDGNTALMGRALSAAGKHTEAVMSWKALIQEDKSNPDSWTGLARALEAAGDYSTAQRCHEKANALRNLEPEYDPLSMMMDGEEPEPAPEQPYAPEPVSNLGYGLEVEPEAEVPLPVLTERAEPEPLVQEARPEVDLAAAALEATSRDTTESIGKDSDSRSIANQDIEWYNKGVGLIEDKKYREALSCFDRALPSFAGDDQMVIRILNGRGNALYYLADYPKCVESYHKAMVINPSGVQGKTLYNMGTAYAEMQRFGDAIKCFEQSIPRGLDEEQVKLAKEQIRRCTILHKEQQRKLA
ncbi:MAG: tetratricopeptide repeat protein [Candidatus Poseidoniaceae archaeon]|nr:tetratricopeptide repeat protein [Candidatus Poseidoniaceae archaeon]